MTPAPAAAARNTNTAAESEEEMNYWMAVGRKENWDTAFQNGNIWGLKETQRHLWQASS